MAFTGSVTDGYLPAMRSSEATNTIPQWGVVCLDVTTTNGVVRGDSSNAGVCAGINEDTGAKSDGTTGVGIDLQPTNACKVAFRRISKVILKSGDSAAPGTKLYVTSSSVGEATTTVGSNKFLGYALDTLTGDGTAVVSLLVGTLSGT